MAQVLQLTFANIAGSTMTININDPKPNLTEAEVNAAMQTIIDQAVFSKDGFLFNVKKSARIVERNVTAIELIS
ncbi:hypothetical protein JOC25_000348 [Solibacillus kalamii]|uniref:DUF2922 domain-containing protein n=2 Tax=Solibacillus TaxID=648800 RepID=F2F3Q7_SOLSS|nr:MULTISPECIES: DUF2922 domain-containing protein [Solibacillus]MBM7663892.1 hypothetical protein [Solibacillus kalamii]OBW60343.1 hypothetical protein A9986_03995 [Solibacillus silvestris]OUZ39524.1 DUF2922 domain-containing protein [Solibacillus kalamii]BAK16424.1 hypothetical protein SSIL_2001 [Solibacillus silvestris StLB046]